jgi:L-lactate dehydrogenase
MPSLQRKVVIIGAGSVGTTYAYALMQTGLANQIVITDIDEERLHGEIMDLSHGLPFVPPVSLKAGDYSDCSDADLIVLTAGAKQKPGESRLELVQKNTKIVKSICDQIRENTQQGVIVVVTNPVDILTYVAIKHLNWPKGRVIGSGTVLDTSRFKYMLSQHCNIDARNVHAYILGEHGDSEIPAWSLSHIAGVNINEYCQKCLKCNFKEQHKNIVQQVKDSAYHIIDYKGATYYAIGLSLVKISQAILRNESSVLTVSTLLEGEYGIEDICLSTPAIVGRQGVTQMIHAELPEQELKGLQNSANKLKESLAQIEL